MTTRIDTRLADGRDLFYFDCGRHERSTCPDRRLLDPLDQPCGSELRRDPLFGEYAVIATHRQSRTHLPSPQQCPLCPSRGDVETEVPSGDYQVAVLENRFPAFTTTTSSGPDPFDDPLFVRQPGAGRCEVVCFTSDHNTAFSQLSPARVRTVIDALADRTHDLSQLRNVAYVYCFENRGEDIGVTLSHPHGQIYGYPFVPERFQRAARAARRHRRHFGGCLQCDLLDAEVKANDRIVAETEHWVSYVPFASRWPFQLRVVPRAHVADLPALSDEQRNDLVAVYLSGLRRFDALFDSPSPYIANWQQAPVRQDRDVWHLALEIFTIRRARQKLKYLAGSESGAGVWINDIRPETAAEQLRAAIPGEETYR